MGRSQNLAIHVHLDEAGTHSTVERDVREGLTGSPKQLPSKYFYDERGSSLFEQITELPEYYLTRAETALLERHAKAIERLTRFEDLVELGSGSAKKTRMLIEAGRRTGSLRRYVAVEVSRETAEAAAHSLHETYRKLDVHVVVGDFERHLDRVPSGRRRLFVLLGSTIGNFPDEHAIDLLRKLKRRMCEGDFFLLGTDLVKDRTVLEAAYNDSQGVTAEFNRNILNVINDQVDGDFDASAFEHVSRYNEGQSRIESGLRAKRPQSVTLKRLDLKVRFEAGEKLRTEVSHKYTRQSVSDLLEAAGLTLRHWFTDEDEMFALSLSN